MRTCFFSWSKVINRHSPVTAKLDFRLLERAGFYLMRTLLTKEQEKEIVIRFQNLETTAQIAKVFNRPIITIYKLLKRNNVRMRRTPDERFWMQTEKRLPDECWEWIGSKNDDGYGSIQINKTLTKAHRFSWQISNGEIPTGLCVLHKCDNPSCVNPNHLFLGTQQDNIIDMHKKGRLNYKTRKPNPKSLPQESINELCQLYATGNYKQNQLSKMFNISTSSTNRYVKRGVKNE